MRPPVTSRRIGRPVAGLVRRRGSSRTSQIGATVASSESSRSIRPPWPGMTWLMSLMPRSRFITDSHRSPSVAITAAITPSEDADPPVAVEQETTTSSPPTTQATTEPAKPSHDFFGEMTGAIGCLPKSTPAA